MVNDAQWRLPVWFADASPVMLGQLKVYHSELMKFNPRINLISRHTEANADEVHFADGLAAARLLPFAAGAHPIYDFGSGNGVPGLILATVHPNSEFVLVESDSRKVEFLKHVIHVLKLKNVRTECLRVEKMAPASVSVMINRGFASIAKTLAITRPLMAASGEIFHLKGSGWAEEITEAQADPGSSWRSELLSEYRLPVSGATRAIVRSFLN